MRYIKDSKLNILTKDESHHHTCHWLRRMGYGSVRRVSGPVMYGELASDKGGAGRNGGFDRSS